MDAPIRAVTIKTAANHGIEDFIACLRLKSTTLARRDIPTHSIAHYRPELENDPFCAFVQRLLEKAPDGRPTNAGVCLTALQGLPESIPASVAQNETAAPLHQPIRQQVETFAPEQDAETRTSARRYSTEHVSRRGSTSGKSRSWLGPVLLAAIVLNGVLALLLMRSTFREQEVVELAKIEEKMQATRIVDGSATRARMHSPESTAAAGATEIDKTPLSADASKQAAVTAGKLHDAGLV